MWRREITMRQQKRVITPLANLTPPITFPGAVASLPKHEPGQEFSLKELEAVALELRRSILRTITAGGSGHPGGSLSAVEILVALYYRVLNHDPNNPAAPERDRFILSKGHIVPALYAVLADWGYIHPNELTTLRKIGSRLQGHSHIMTPGIEMSGGSLGQGLSFAIGTALAARLDQRNYRVYALLGDGECDEGQIWEAAMSAAHHGVTNLTAIIDRNRIQNDRFTSETMELEPLADKWRSFSWNTLEVNGHAVEELLGALGKAIACTTQPTIIIAQTVKGKGVSFMENNPAFHGKAPTPEQLEQALQELS